MSPIELQMSDASKRAIDKLKGQGLTLNEGYTYDPPSLPEDVTSVDDDELMDMYAKYVAYLEFINLQMWCANTDKEEAEKDMTVMKARKKLSMKASGVAVALIDSEIEVDPEYRACADAFQELSNYHGLMNIMSGKLSKDISFINREITRRVNLNKMSGRSTWMTT
jgi:hypothetical protein